MYSAPIIARKMDQLFRAPQFNAVFPGGVPEYSVADCRAITARIVQAYDPEAEILTRTLTPEEDQFIAYARLRLPIDAPWYLETFVYIDEEGHGIRPLYPLWDSQRFMLERLGRIELQQDSLPNGGEGILLNILKVRQVGISTFGAALCSHRIFTQAFIRAILGSDTEEQARYLFRMVERIYEQLPFFLRPARAVPYSAGRELHLSTKSSIKTAWGKTTRGALQETGGKKGNIERGRSQPLDEPVLTPQGWRPMGSLQVGNRVIGSSGRATRICGVFPQEIEPVYRVTFSDGSWTRCSGDHLWQVTTAYKRWRGLQPVVRTTRDLLDGGLHWNKPSGRMAKWFVPIVNPVVFAAVTLPIPAYTLGAYLGDGTTRTGALQIAARDPEIKARVAAELPSTLRLTAPAHDWHIRRTSARVPHVYLDALTALGLRYKYAYEKSIPPLYLTASIPDRVALLQGLLDTDGWVQAAEGRVCYSTTSPQLAQDVQALVESLGGVARLKGPYPPKKAHIRRNGQRIVGKQPFYRLSICLPAEICPFHVPRKIAGLRPTAARKYFPSRAIVSIELVEQMATQCLRVEAHDQLYVTRHCLVTHNTNSVVHISELATWDNPEQLDSSLFPGIPRSPVSLVFLESTAELAGDWWHRHWLATEEGEGRFQNLFFPWPVRYRSLAPADWSPNDITLKVAAQLERDSFSWVGETMKLTRDHLFWYESTRSYYAKKNQLLDFLKEFPSNPSECFQYAGRSVFSHEEMAQIDQAARPLLDVWSVEPSREIAELRQMGESTGNAALDAKVLALKADKRPAAPILLHPSATTPGAGQFPIPPGYGFRRLGKEEISLLPSLRHTAMAIYEYPRVRGQRRYVLGVDVGDGLGQDYSVISVVRLPTIEEVAEEVAQFVSNAVRPAHLAYIADAIGRLYADDDALEAQIAVELNNHGVTVQDMLQLHLGYTNFYVWEVVDAASPEARFTKRIGWSTTTRTRPILLEKFHDAVTAFDPLTGLADFRLNSAVTRAELRHFVTEGLLGEAEHARGQHDDCIFASGIAYYVAHRLAGGESEPISERRRRRAQILRVAATTGQRRDYRNSPVTAEEADDASDPDTAEFDDDAVGLYFTDRDRG